MKNAPAETGLSLRYAEAATMAQPSGCRATQSGSEVCDVRPVAADARSDAPDRAVLPRSRGGKDEWENLVWADKDVNARKGNRLPHEAGLKLLTVPRAPKELPVTALIRNPQGIADWKLFLKE